MAQVAQDTTLHARIDYYLDYLIDQWEGLQEVAAEWNEWDEESRRTFLANWGVVRDRMDQIRRWALEEQLAPDQAQRLKTLEALVVARDSDLALTVGH